MWRTRWTAAGEARFLGFVGIARRLALRAGVTSVTFDAMARASGLGKSTVQSFFGTITELRLGLLDDWRSAVQERVLRREHLGLRGLWAGLQGWLVLHPWEYSLPLELLRQGPPAPRDDSWMALRTTAIDVLKAWAGFVEDVCAECAELGQLRAGTRVDELARGLTALTTTIELRAAIDGPEQATTSVGAAAWQLLAHAAVDPAKALPTRDTAIQSIFDDVNARAARREAALEDEAWLFPARAPEP